MSPRRADLRLSRDTIASAAGSAVFSCSLGIASVAMPLVALRSGYSPAEVGVLTALSAVAQMSTRLVLGAAMRRVGDWVLVLAAGLLLSGSNGLVSVSAAAVPFVVAEVLQGIARACFWTGSQTHVIRGGQRSVGALATVNFVSSLGLLVGPAAAGLMIERSPRMALLVAAIVAAAALPFAVLLTRLPPFVAPPGRPPGRIWRRAGVDVGCWAGVTAGAWRALLTSYVPVVLDAGGQSAAVVGALVSTANGASVVGAAVVARARGRWIRRAFLLGTLTAGGATAVVAFVAFVAGSWPVTAALLAVSGLGVGVLQTLGPAIAADAVHPEERGEAIAAAGSFRAAALLAAPLAVAGALAVVPLTVAMGLAGLVITAGVAVGRSGTWASDFHR